MKVSEGVWTGVLSGRERERDRECNSEIGAGQIENGNVYYTSLYPFDIKGNFIITISNSIFLIEYLI